MRAPYRTRDWVALLLVLVVNTMLLASFYDRFWWPPDEGYLAHVAERVLDGEVLSRDIQSGHAGYIHFINAAALWLFGRTLVSLRYPLVLITLAQACLVFFLFRSRGPWVAATAGVSVTALGVLQFLNPTPHWYCLFLFVVIASCLYWMPARERWRYEILGLLVTTLFLFRMLSGVLVAIGLIAYLLMEAAQEGSARGRETLLARVALGVMAVGLTAYLVTTTELLLFGIWPVAVLIRAAFTTTVANRQVFRLFTRLALGSAIAVLPLVLYHAAHGSLVIWFDDVLMGPLLLSRMEFIRASNFWMLVVSGARGAKLATDAVGVMNGLFWSVLPLFAALQGAVVLRRLYRSGRDAPRVEAFPILAVFYAVVSVHYQIPIYLFYSVGVSVLGLLWQTQGARVYWKAAMIGVTLALSAIAVTFHAGQPVGRGWWGMIAGERVPTQPSDALQRCGLWIDAADLERYVEMTRLIQEEVSPEETIFAVPNHPELYFLADRTNPFRFYNLAFGVRDEQQAEAVVSALQRNPPKLVLYNPADKYNTPMSRRVMRTVEASYDFVGTVGPQQIFRRRYDRPAEGQ
jgi:hypothetical protein